MRDFLPLTNAASAVVNQALLRQAPARRDPFALLTHVIEAAGPDRDLVEPADMLLAAYVYALELEEPSEVPTV